MPASPALAAQAPAPTMKVRKAVAAALGVCVGLSGLDHGFFETLQGNTATRGLVVQAIGPDQRMWVHGTEEAFTIVPNFLATGILAMILGVLTIAWSIRFIDRLDGSRVLLGLGLLLFLVGGGIGMLVFLAFGWVAARRIHRQPRLPLWPARAQQALATAEPSLVALGLALYACALEIAIVGFVPGVSDPDVALLVCWAALGGALVAFGLALAGTARRPGVIAPEAAQ